MKSTLFHVNLKCLFVNLDSLKIFSRNFTCHKHIIRVHQQSYICGGITLNLDMGGGCLRLITLRVTLDEGPGTNEFKQSYC
jgi:hypothetical protein